MTTRVQTQTQQENNKKTKEELTIPKEQPSTKNTKHKLTITKQHRNNMTQQTPRAPTPIQTYTLVDNSITFKNRFSTSKQLKYIILSFILKTSNRIPSKKQ